MGAAFVALGQALVDAITVGLIGDNKDAAVGVSGRCGEQECAGNECWGESHGGTGERKEAPQSDRPKVLIMINHAPVGGRLAGPNWLQNGRNRALTASPGLGHGGTMNGHLAIGCICREIIS